MIVKNTTPFRPANRISQAATPALAQKPQVEKTDVYVSHKKVSVPIGEQPVSIGRHDDSAIKINELKVSRRHAEIKKVDGQLWLRDLGSTNGTYVNGESLPKGEWTKIDEDSQLAFSTRPGGAVNFTGGNPEAFDSRSEARSKSGMNLPLPAEGSTLFWGRDPELKNSLAQTDETSSVSRRHLLIRQTGGTFWVNDLGSRHGTTIDGKAVNPKQWTEFRPGSKLAMSNFEVGIEAREG